MSTSPFEPSDEACCFLKLCRIAGAINDHWALRWDRPGACFRGVEDATYDLNPGLLRDPYPTTYTELASLENNMWVDFRLRSKPLLGRSVPNAWEALIVMQQHGFPTRLLDWSRTLAVAAHFAVRNSSNDGKDGAVWVMASRHLMESRGSAAGVHTAIGDPEVELLALRTDSNDAAATDFNKIIPAPIIPDFLSPRMVPQRSMYTLHSFRRDVLTDMGQDDEKRHRHAAYLHKIIIPRGAKAGFRSALPVLTGVMEETLFPDLDGFARDFVRETRMVWEARAKKSP